MNDKRIELDQIPVETTNAGLEQHFINEFLAEKGLTWEDLVKLPPEEARQLRIDACKYATARLAELEARARFVSTLHAASQEVTL